MSDSVDLTRYGIRATKVLRNAGTSRLYEEALRLQDGVLADNGALVARSGEKTGRSPKDKRIVEHADLAGDVWWGDVNVRFDPQSFAMVRQQAIDYLNSRPQLYVQDGYAGWDSKYRLKIRVVCARPYHALFMHNLLIRPPAEELPHFGSPDYILYNAGEFPANRFLPQLTSGTSISLDFKRHEMVILGTEYAGEMKKGVFTIMHYLMPQRGVLSMHCSANEGEKGDVALFFGLSGTGKTTLSADPRRRLIGDDEHGWSQDGIFNIEGGCYAKCINLSRQQEPSIYDAIRFGTVLENVVLDPRDRSPLYADTSITENTRAAYPIESVGGAKVPCIGAHPKHVIFLTCDASGVLPPVSKLTTAQAMYHFLSGYTARVAGTEVGVTEPQVAFSACFSAAFLVWPPTRYAEMLAEKLRAHGAQTWLVNTGWSGGEYGVGSRIKLSVTRAMIDAILNGSLARVATYEEPYFGLHVPQRCPGVPDHLLLPEQSWSDQSAYQRAATRLARSFQANFERYAATASEEVKKAGPRVS